MKHPIALLLLMLIALTATAQTPSLPPDAENLVYNPSFEECRECPRKIDALGTLTIVDAWYQPTAGSADYYNRCGHKECQVPQNKLGIQDPRTGVGYVGIYCSKTEYREYMQTQLKQPLQAGATYRLTFYVSLSEYSTGAVATLGGLFTHSRISDTSRSVLTQKEVRQIAPKVSQVIASYYEPQVVNPYDRLLSDTKGWTEITGTFRAQGGEEFLTIGNFYTASHSNLSDLDSITYYLPGSYYYLDDVSVVCLDCPTDTLPHNTAVADTPRYEIGTTIVLENIFFDFDKSTLLQQSYNELQHLLTILEQHPTMKIEIRGHTDGKGSANYNQRLSEERAKAVVEYLMAKGINIKRLRYRGYGKSQPISTNDTEEGRARNRRVEFHIFDL